MSAREAILGKIRAALKAPANDQPRREGVAQRLATAPAGVIPARGQLDAAGRTALFKTLAQSLAATVAGVAGADDVPEAVADYLRDRNLAPVLRMGADPRLAAMP